MEYFTEFPDAGDTLFKAMSSEDGNVDLSFLKGDKYIFCYADGFKRAGDAAVVEYLSTHEWYKEPELFPPAMYNYRHFIELTLKWQILCGNARKISSVSRKDLGKHNLELLWGHTRPIVEQVWPDCAKESIDSVERIILQVHAIDESGQNMRYAEDRDGNHTLTKVPEIVSLDHVRKVMQKLWQFFQRLSYEWQGFGLGGWESDEAMTASET